MLHQETQSFGEDFRAPCANPQSLVAGKPGDKFTLDIEYHQGRKHLPIIKLKRAA